MKAEVVKRITQKKWIIYQTQLKSVSDKLAFVVKTQRGESCIWQGDGWSMEAIFLLSFIKFYKYGFLLWFGHIRCGTQNISNPKNLGEFEKFECVLGILVRDF